MTQNDQHYQEKLITDNSGLQNESGALSNSESLDYSNTSKLSIKESVSTFFQCQICPFQTRDKYGLRRHIRLIHEKIRRLRCSQCDMTSDESTKLRDHLLKRHGKMLDIKCAICDYSHKEFKSVLEHFRTVHPMKINIKDAKIKHAKIKHAKITKNIKNRCKTCKKSFWTKMVYKTHLKYYDHSKMCYKWECEICGYITKLSKDFKIHLKTHLDGGNKKNTGDDIQVSTVAKESVQMYNNLELNTAVEKDTHMNYDLQMITEINESLQMQVDTIVKNNLQLNTVVKENDIMDKTLQENTVIQTVIHMNDDLQLKTEICENVQMQVDTVVGINLQVNTVVKENNKTGKNVQKSTAIETDTHMNDDLQTNTVVDGKIQMTDSLQVDTVVEEKTQSENMNTVVKKEALIKIENIKEEIIEFSSFLCDICDFKAQSYDDIQNHCEIHVKSVGVDVDQLFSKIEF